MCYYTNWRYCYYCHCSGSPGDRATLTHLSHSSIIFLIRIQILSLAWRQILVLDLPYFKTQSVSLNWKTTSGSHGEDILLLGCYVRISWARRSVVVTLFTVVMQRPNTEISSQVEKWEGSEQTLLHLRCPCVWVEN